ncbi:helix-turn-helix domain-containing protein [Actinosynnema sp. NPDC023658]|uniref:helix-turn-helix domain-containing protein n=1 Tax=Actinosynnema sp. NPDC023658 TaxID=3155465 RepID=UPI0033E29D7C
MSNVLAFPPQPDPTDHDTGYAGAVPVIDPNRLTYTVDEAAYLLDLSRGAAYQAVREGTIPAERVGRRWIIPRKRFHAWLDGLIDDQDGGR